jgi:hypothetical protein
MGYAGKRITQRICGEKTTTSRMEKVGYACINVVRDKLLSV